jgi:hypothetical protein
MLRNQMSLAMYLVGVPLSVVVRLYQGRAARFSDPGLAGRPKRETLS